MSESLFRGKALARPVRVGKPIHMRKLLLTSALAVSCLTAAPAAAAVTIITANGVEQPLIFTNGSATASFGASYSTADMLFTDRFSFTLGQAATLTSGALLTEYDKGLGTGDLDISSVSLFSQQLRLSTLVKLAGPADKVEMFDLPAGSVGQLLGPGSYSVVVAGLANKVGADANKYGPGSYTGSLSFATAAPQSPAVPEPSTWAMMLVGFGFVGGALRSAKRRKNVTVSYA